MGGDSTTRLLVVAAASFLLGTRVAIPPAADRIDAEVEATTRLAEPSIRLGELAEERLQSANARRPLALGRRHRSVPMSPARSPMATFLNMTLRAPGQPSPKLYKEIPGLVDLDLFLWETRPKPVLMLWNSHITWYTTNPTEKRLVAVMRHVLSVEHTPRDGVVVDLGINDGYIAALAATYSYGVVAIDAQPECVRRFNFASAVNEWGDVRIYNNIVMQERKTLAVPNGVCGGGSRYQGKEAKIIDDKGVKEMFVGSTQVHSVAMDTLIPSEDVVFFHLDVEGAELSVMRSATQLFSRRRVKHIIWEFAPHRWAERRADALREVQRFMAPFTCRHVAELPLQLPSDPLQVGGVIEDWPQFYEKCEAARRITDVWCHL
mmetsp:Transcript_7466/g.19199  ORF Transcript_7466/g.19199 Transcript_7466/m.19199 type:complete len:377 (-) Transcript_7466:267-1397(-)|eukprot:CAMPEP_0182931878 /NCGR_PEP_ID=MMETSP0105_2-20130417/29726_1 /TAXON_ID=81532 ORGANISM="Acanthoeca-like sp., Strain 10tr" /NCGR_SAMPLE_ID=MMETSP0105_2 /ASSEMBLY_ACC=CAM_ASM_000205 /LENGTH=376 /DNA_ID=CAMNT_0025070399 /DNA_START=107 /DNA_END=1237 /DNA_ORIENTATION=-